MAAVTIRNLSDEAHRALKLRAAEHNRSTEAEMRAILEAAVQPADRLRLGSALFELSRKFGLTDAEIDIMDQVRDRHAAEPMRFE
jgi:plasmid stability protein